MLMILQEVVRDWIMSNDGIKTVQRIKFGGKILQIQ